MRRTRSLGGFVIAIALAALVAFAPVVNGEDEVKPGTQSAQQHEVTTTVDGEEVSTTLHYWLFLPEGYATDAQKQWPLMLFLHGAGERGDDPEKVKIHGPPKIVAAKPDFPFVVISPQCPTGKRWESAELAQLVDYVAGTNRVDKERMYITGLSMGGYGTWSLIAEYPKLFAAAVPICGGGNPETAEKIGKLPIWTFHGAQDRTVPLSRSQQMVDAIKEAGGSAKLTVYPEAGHDSWTETYDNPEVYTWLLSHQRGE
ncbi:MAG: prolyl oligopeptidase family serine peptidase [Pirellulales bacterium]